MQMSIVELWDDLLKTDLILPSNIFKSASYLGIPDESRGKIWLHMIDQREKRCGTQHQSDFKVKNEFFGNNCSISRVFEFFSIALLSLSDKRSGSNSQS